MKVSDTTVETPKNRSWPRRALAFCGRMLVTFLLMFYVILGVQSSYNLFKITRNNNQPLSALSALIEKSVAGNRINEVTEWVRFRPMEETQALIDIITPKSGELGAALFFELMRRQIRLNHPEDALFWSQLGRYRMRYDVLRCGVPDAEQTFSSIINYFSSPVLGGLLQKHPELVKKSIRQVMDFDKKYPASNRPDSICDIVYKITRTEALQVPEDEWKTLHNNLRFVTEKSLEEMDRK